MINIIGKRNIWFSVSGVLVLVSLLALVVFGLKPGIDFTGGSLMEISFTGERPAVQELRDTLISMQDTNLGSVVVQPTGENGFILKMRYVTEDEHQRILDVLRSQFQVSASEPSSEGEQTFSENRLLEERIETIGPVVSAHLKERSIQAAVAVILAIVLYVAYAFRKVSKPVQSWKYGITAVIALLHDVIITMGVFAVLGRYINVEVDIPFVVALLTILGYSVNDTIVVFDRVRENLIKYGYSKFEEVVNMGVNQSISRSINTGLTTLIVLFALFLFGGESIQYFALALIIGVAFGTYSSIFLASPLLVVWRKFTK